ncbi:MAG: ParB/RepB/Spo0J family partition protein [Kiritimatiellae bacterium]|nr:ParB/RepB/Spo0J family partition protein [Kiritimatiellia bacterium]
MEKIKLKTLRVAELEHAPWNPRSEAELDWQNPRMVELIESVRAGGIAQSLAVWECDDGQNIVIAGNRRLEAARAVGLASVPALVFSGISEARAQEITRTENEIRQGVDPLQDALLIERMLSKGVDQKTIAAHFGMSEAMVCRRAKLINLDDSVRAVVAEGGNIAIDALEQIALYPADVQRRCSAEIRRYSNTSGVVRWRDISWKIKQMTRSLDDAIFNTSCCVACPNRTGAQPDLWAEIPEDGKLGDCICSECFERKVREFDLGRIREIVGDGVELVDANEAGLESWRADRLDCFALKRSADFPVAWYWINDYESDASDRYNLRYGPTLEDYRAFEEAEEERRDREREAAEAESAEAKAKRAERRALDDEVEGCVSRILSGLGGEDHASFKKAVKKCVAGATLKGAAATMLAQIINDWWTYDANPNESIEFLVAVPGFAKALKVEKENLDAYKAALKKLEAWDKANSCKA